MLRLGSEFTLHKSLHEQPKGPTVFLYQLKAGTQWTTQNTVTAEVAERINAIMEGRDRKPGKDWRLWDTSKPEPKPRVRKATAKAAVDKESAE